MASKEQLLPCNVSWCKQVQAAQRSKVQVWTQQLGTKDQTNLMEVNASVWQAWLLDFEKKTSTNRVLILMWPCQKFPLDATPGYGSIGSILLSWQETKDLRHSSAQVYQIRWPHNKQIRSKRNVGDLGFLSMSKTWKRSNYNTYRYIYIYIWCTAATII